MKLFKKDNQFNTLYVLYVLAKLQVAGHIIMNNKNSKSKDIHQKFVQSVAYENTKSLPLKRFVALLALSIETVYQSQLDIRLPAH